MPLGAGAALVLGAALAEAIGDDVTGVSGASTLAGSRAVSVGRSLLAQPANSRRLAMVWARISRSLRCANERLRVRLELRGAMRAAEIVCFSCVFRLRRVGVDDELFAAHRAARAIAELGVTGRDERRGCRSSRVSVHGLRRDRCCATEGHDGDEGRDEPRRANESGERCGHAMSGFRRERVGM